MDEVSLWEKPEDEEADKVVNEDAGREVSVHLEA
jgi:hypothetical protein